MGHQLFLICPAVGPSTATRSHQPRLPVMSSVSKTWSGSSLDAAMQLAASQHSKNSSTQELEEDLEAELEDS